MRLWPRRARRSWQVPRDTRTARHEALDWALLNTHICTRREREGIGQGDSLMGDYLEFGVFEGNSFLHAHHRARDLMPWMRFFAFDSFEGLPALSGDDAHGEFYEGQFACSQSQFEEILGREGADMSRIRIVPGWYDRALTDEVKRTHNLSVCTVAMIDCDLQASAVPVLDFLTSLIRTGTILLFDDWYNFRGDPELGVRKATRNWLDQNPQFELEKWHPFCHHGQSFIVRVRAEAAP